MDGNQAELVAVYGRRGGGKTTIAKGLVAAAKKLIVFDPMAEYAGRGWTQCETREGVKQAMIKGWRRGFKISYVPPAGGEIEALHWLALMAKGAQATFAQGGDTRRLTMVVDEAHTGLPVTPLPKGMQGMIEVIRRGRHWGIEAVAVTQHPHALSPDFRMNAARTYLLPLGPGKVAQNAASSIVGTAGAETLRELKPFHFLLVEDGAVRKGKVQKNGKLAMLKA